jgi:hypothetical protein
MYLKQQIIVHTIPMSTDYCCDICGKYNTLSLKCIICRNVYICPNCLFSTLDRIDYCKDCNVFACNNLNEFCEDPRHPDDYSDDEVSAEDEHTLELCMDGAFYFCSVCDKETHILYRFTKGCNNCAYDHPMIDICCRCNKRSKEIYGKTKEVLGMLNKLLLDPSKIVAEYWDSDSKEGVVIRDNKFIKCCSA